MKVIKIGLTDQQFEDAKINTMLAKMRAENLLVWLALYDNDRLLPLDTDSAVASPEWALSAWLSDDA